MNNKFVTQVVIVREGYDNRHIQDISSLHELNIKTNDPYYKTQTIDIGDTISLDSREYKVKDINFLLYPLNHIELQKDLEVNCQVNIFLELLIEENN